jgi:autotransporter-associated beta strand protein
VRTGEHRSNGDAYGPQRRRVSLRRSASAAVIVGACAAAAAAHAQDATWTGPGAEWTTGGNWSTASVPTDTATFTNNSAPTSVTISNSATIGEILFDAGAPAYSFTVQPAATLFVNGTGLINNSVSPQSFATNGSSIVFENSSTAGNAVFVNTAAGILQFINTSTAGSASITNNGSGNVVAFSNTSTSGSANISNNSGFVGFFDTSTAGGATITNNSGQVIFYATSTAGNAALINNAAGSIDFSSSTGPNHNDELSAGSIAGAGVFYLGADQLTVGADDLSTDVSGIISDCGTGGNQCSNAGTSGGSLVKVGTGTLTLSGTNTYTGETAVDGGTLLVNGSIASSNLTTVNSDGTLGGIGTVGATTVRSGGTLMPGVPGSTGTLNVNGSLAFSSGSNYTITINGIAASKTDVTGAATPNSNANVKVASGGTIDVGQKYTILTAQGGVSGTFDPTVTDGIYTGTLSYDPDDVFLTFYNPDEVVPTLNYSKLTLLLPPAAPTNVINVADAIDSALASGATLPMAYQNLFNLSGTQLENSLSQLSGEAATGAQQSAFQMENLFLSLLLDPYADGRGGDFAAGAAPAALGYTSDTEPNLPPAMADAYASVLKEPAPAAPPRWNVWGAGFGGANANAGNASVGSHDTSTGAGGFAIGADDYVAAGTMLGFALAGGGTAWSLSAGLGGGRSDVFQAGLYGVHEFGNAYVAGAFGFGNYWVTTNRDVTIAGGGTLNSNFQAQGYGGRVEGGYHIPLEAVTLTPYAAVQPQAFTTPAFGEYAISGSSSFALSDNAQTGTEVRGELGTWVSKTMLLPNGNALSMFGRAAWAHDWQSNPNLDADFLALPAASFVVNGAEPPPDLALATAGVELRLTNGWTLMAKFDGEFGRGSDSYAGTGRLTYSW